MTFLEELYHDQTLTSLGQLFWFTVDPRPLPQSEWIQAITQANLAAYGLPQGITPTTAYRRAFLNLRMAARKQHIASLIRLVDQDKTTTTHHWIRETRTSGHIVFTAVGEFIRNKSSDTVSITPLDSLSSPESQLLATFPDLMDFARQHYTSGDRRRQILHWLSTVDSLKMRHAGPVHFIPADGSGLIDQLITHQNSLGIQAWRIPLPPSGDAMDTVLDSLEHQIRTQTATMLQTLHKAQDQGHDLSVAQQKALLVKFHAIQDRVTHYTQIFQNGSDAIQAHLSVLQDNIANLFALI
jgi:hypothetical protein